jgi:AAA15 family ATPase/GTPase
MGKEHLTYFKVENFKRFDVLELTDIGQFNLIVGDNNVGKTSLLEALSLFGGDVDFNDMPKSLPSIFSNFLFTLYRRNIVVDNDVDLFFKNISKIDDNNVFLNFSTNKNNSFIGVEFSKIRADMIKVQLFGNDSNRHGPIEHTSHIHFKPFNNSYVPANIDFNLNIVNDYYDTLKMAMSNKKIIVNNLKTIHSHIVEIEVLPISNHSHVMIGFDNQDLFFPVTALGESAVRVFYYLLHIIKNRNKILSIDEIDSGIHYTRMRGFLKNIIQLAIKNDVQLFMTTHSLECQQAFAEVFEDEDMLEYQEQVRQYTLIEKNDGSVSAVKRTLEQIEFGLETNNDTRGGKWP